MTNRLLFICNTLEFNCVLFLIIRSSDEKFGCPSYKYIRLTSQIEIKDICQPFFKESQLSYLLYIRHFKNNQRLWLTTHGEWSEYYFKKQYHLLSPFENTNSTVISGKYLWSTLSGQQVFMDARLFFDIDHGITIVNHLKDCVEFVHLAANGSHSEVLNFYLNKMNHINQFIFYFRDIAKDLIKMAEQNMLPFSFNRPVYLKNVHQPHQCLPSYSLTQKKLLSENYHYSAITPREAECIEWLKKGKTATEIALILGTSKRTVETHLKSLKEKLRCYNSFQLGYLTSKIDHHQI